MKIRIGNDITIRATVTRRGADEDFTNKTLHLLLRSPYERRELSFLQEGNVLTAVFYGKDQTKTGSYTVTLVEEFQDSEKSRNTTDYCRAFELVSCSCQTADTLTGSQTVDLNLDLSVAANGLSAYEIALINGFTGTEEEWLASLHGADGVGTEDLETIETRLTSLENAPEIETIEGMKVRRYAGGNIWVLVDEVELSSDFEKWAASSAVCGRKDFSLIFVHQKNDNNEQTGMLINTLSDSTDNALQTYFWGNGIYYRSITEIETAPKVSDWYNTRNYSLSFDAETNSVNLLAPNGDILSTITLPVSTADTSEIEADITELQSKVTSLETNAAEAITADEINSLCS